MTESQREALSLDRHIAVRANAGSGKTSVLTRRYVWIVVHDNKAVKDSIASIVAITFTVKAAAEMRKRIYDMVLGLLADSELRESMGFTVSDDVAVRRLDEMRSLVSQARIQTIHAFCNGILRKHGHEIGIDPESREIPKSELNELLMFSVRQALRTSLTDENTRKQTLDMYEDVSIATMESSLVNLLKDVEHSGDENTWLKGLSIAEIAEQRALRSARILAPQVLEFVLQTLAHLTTVDLENEAVAREWFARFRKHEVALSAETVDITRVKAAVADLATVYAKNGSAKKEIVPGRNKELKPEPLPDAWKQLQTIVSATHEAELVQASITRTLRSITENAQMLFSKEKRRRREIDYSDMISCTIELIRSRADVALEVQRSVNHLMVDEFQDTDPRQLELIRLMCPELDEPSLTTRTTLFIVGDPKQSIYRFRGADVRCFIEAEQLIERVNAKRGLPSGRILLQHSFRMAPELVDHINRICRGMFVAHSDYNPFDVEYELLVAGRTSTADSTPGTIRMLESTVEDWKESELIADAICSILDGKTDITNALPSDIAVLTRTNSQVADITQALISRGIPVRSHGGNAFFSRPEVADVRNLLKWSSDLSDRNAFLALLRSPLFNLSDVELTMIALSSSHGASLESLNACIERGKATATMINAGAVLNACARRLSSTTPSAFLRNVLYQCNWHQTLFSDARREQILANVEKIIDIIDSEHQRPGATLFDVLAAIEIPDVDSEGDESYSTNSNAVQLLTVHGAKGLEFPIVFLADIAKERNRGGMLTSTLLGPTFELSKSEGRASASHYANDQLRRSASLAELRRLYYVALTRAKEHIFVAPQHDLMQNYFMGIDVMAVSPDDVSYTGQADQQEWIDVSFSLSETGSLSEVTVTQLGSTQTQLDILGDEGARMHALLVGNAVHDILATWIAYPELKRVNSSSIESEIMDRYALNGVQRTDVQRHLRNIESTSVLANFKENCEAEVTLVGLLSDTVVNGRLDLLSISGETADIWDWKTNAVGSHADMLDAASNYDIHMQAYAWLSMRSPAIQSVNTHLAFTARAASDADWIVSASYTRQDLPSIEERLKGALNVLYLTTINGSDDEKTPAAIRM